MLRGGHDFLLLDCREEDEWGLCRIPGAKLMPMGEIAGRLQELDPDKPVVVYCHHGVRSRQVALFLKQQEFDQVHSMTGGIDAWSRLIDSTIPTY